MNPFMTDVLWIDFRTCRVFEDTMDFRSFSSLMKQDACNDIQILLYQKAETA